MLGYLVSLLIRRKKRIGDAAYTPSICVIGEICGLFPSFPSPSPLNIRFRDRT
jgi:hypothetical protein